MNVYSIHIGALVMLTFDFKMCFILGSPGAERRQRREGGLALWIWIRYRCEYRRFILFKSPRRRRLAHGNLCLSVCPRVLQVHRAPLVLQEVLPPLSR